MTALCALFTRLCGFRKQTRPLETNEEGNQSIPPETTSKEQTRDDLQHKVRDSNASDDDNNNANPELPLPPARKAALHGAYSCNNLTVIQKSGSVKKKLRASLTIQMARVSSIARKHEGEEDKSMRNKNLKTEKSILVHPIILGEKCRVPVEEEGDDQDHNQRMPKNTTYHPRSMSSISVSRTISKIDVNVIPVKETSSEDLVK